MFTARYGLDIYIQVNFKPHWAYCRGEPCWVMVCNHERSGMQYDAEVATTVTALRDAIYVTLTEVLA